MTTKRTTGNTPRKTYNTQTISRYDSRFEGKRAATPKEQAYRFFYANAGYSFDPKTETARQGRAKCARELARAERDARALGYTFEWEEDYLDCEYSLGDHAIWCDLKKAKEEHSHEILTCSLVNPDGHSVQTLGAIIDPSREYRRVVEAELAAEELKSGKVVAK